MPREQPGAVLALAALMMVAMIGFVGMAVDVGHQMVKYREAQNAADSAALAAAYAIAAGNSEATAQTEGNAVASQNGFSGVTYTFYDEFGNTTTNNLQVLDVKADLQSSFPTLLVRVLGLLNQSVATTATARVRNYYWCELCVMDTSANSALNIGGGGGISATNIKIVDNSAYTPALGVSNNASLVDNNTSGTGSVSSVGTMTGVANITGSPSPSLYTGISPVPDPLAGVPMLTNPALFTPQSDVHISGTTNATIDPGIYKIIDDQSKGTLTLNPGIYIITGSFNANGGGNIVGNNVMLYFTCPSGSNSFTACPTGGQTKEGSLSLSGNGLITLSAMDSTNSGVTGYNKAYAGLLIFYDRNDTATLSITGNGTSATSYSSVSGTIYAKSSLTTLSGNGSQATQLDSLMVVDQLNITGSTGAAGLALSFDKNKNALPSWQGGLVN